MNIDYDAIFNEVYNLPFYDNKGGRFKEINWEGDTIKRHKKLRDMFIKKQLNISFSLSLIFRSYTVKEIEDILGYSEKDLPKLDLLMKIKI